MCKVTGEVILLAEFRLQGRHVGVVWLPRPDMLVVQVAEPTEIGLRQKYQLLGYIFRPMAPDRYLQRIPGIDAWPDESSDVELELVARAVEIYRAEVPREARCVHERPADSVAG